MLNALLFPESIQLFQISAINLHKMSINITLINHKSNINKNNSYLGT